MAFELKPGTSVRKRLPKVARQRVRRARDELGGHGLTDEGIHTLRKRIKQLRALVRLARPELGAKRARREDHAAREAGRPLSAARDARVVADALGKLMARFKDRAKLPGAAGLKRTLEERTEAVRGQLDPTAVKTMDRALRRLGRRVEGWRPAHRGWKGVEAGLRDIYRAARRAMGRADRSDEDLHEWRKRLQDLRYALELLRPAGPSVIGALADQTDALTDLLGDDHDLLLLGRLAGAELDGSADGEILSALIGQRRRELRHAASAAGATLLLDRPGVFVRRIHACWRDKR